MLNSTFKSRNPKISTSNLQEEFSLPTDVLIEILKRLPLESLFRSTCVCKSWLSLLKSPTFLSTLATFKLRNSRVPQKLLLFKETIDIHTVKPFTNFPVYTCNTITMIKHTEFACKVGRNHFVVGSADGVVCLFEFYCQNPEIAPLILWNSSFRKANMVPFPVHVDGVLEFTSGGFPKLIFGFGFDPCSNRYKAVRVAYYNGRGNESKGTIFRVFVYCVDDCEWRNLGRVLVPQYITTIRWRGVYLNGVIHWICNVSVSLDANCPIQRSILTLNLANGELGEIKLPDKLVVDVAYHTLKVVMVPRGGKEVLGVINKVGSVVSLWVMDKYGVKDSWVELFRVDFKDAIKNDTNVAVLSDQYVVAQLATGWWVLYDHTRRQVHPRWKFLEGSDYVDAYVESLILLGQPNGVLPAKKVQQVGRKQRRGRRHV